MGNLVVEVPNRSGVIKMIERVLRTQINDENRLVSSYRGMVLQVDVDTKSPLVIIKLGKTIPSRDGGEEEKILNEFNTVSVLGTHLIYNLKENLRCYTYRAPCWVDEQVTETAFREFLDRSFDEALNCWGKLYKVSEIRG
ncbi:MAG: hypothetical protein UGF89_02410 [Acutalibacteraceae bacterium]|nr:hypothetical protein [Acutalibacteraceae bacterium]